VFLLYIKAFVSSEKVLENFSRGSWKVLEKSWIFFRWKSGNPA